MKRKITALVLSMTMVLTSGMMSSHAQIGTLNANNAIPNNVGQTDNAENKAVLNDLIEQVDGKVKDHQQVTVIVEVNDENMSKEHGITVPDITKVRTKDGLEDQIDYAKKSQDLLMSEMDEAGVSYQVVEVYDTVLNGVAIKTTLEDAKKIAELDEVKSMELSRTIAAPKLESNSHKTLDETSNGMVEANNIWANYSGKGQLIAILDSGVDPDHEIFKKVDEDSLRIKSEEETNKLLKEKGIEGGKYFNKKIPFGFNYADRNTNVKEGKIQSHGMHVAGIVAANGEKLKGVAPNAQLAIMRVFGQNSMGTTPVIYNKAIDDAVKMGVDSINMSLGATGTTDGRMEQTTINALQKAQEAGIVVAIAIGNDGFMGFGLLDGHPATNPDIGLTNSPGVADLSLAVASVDNVKIKQKGILLNTDPVTKILYQPSDETPFPKDYKNFVHVNEGYVEDFNGVDVNGKIALIKRGDKPGKNDEITFAKKVKNAQDKGAIAAIVYDNVEDGSLVHMAGFKEEGVTIPSCFISKKDGETMIANPNVTVKVDTEESYLQNPNGYKVSSFSSWGMTPEGNLKPDISAPGGQIYSSLNDNNYGLMSGTSMATPHVAGGIAVVKEYVEKKFPSVTGSEKHQLIKNLLMSTAVPYTDKTTNAFSSPRSQGAGLMNLNRAVSSSVVILGTNNISSINLKNIKDNNVVIKGKLKNYSSEAKSFEYYAQLNTDKVENGMAILKPQNIKDTKNSKKSITVGPNAEADFEVTFHLEDSEVEELKKDRPKGFFLEGYVVFENTNKNVNEEISIPFVGFKGDWNALQVIEDSIYDMVSQGKRPTYYEVSDRTAYPFTHIHSKSEGKDVLLGEDPASTYKDPKFDKSKIAFSPNGDGRAEEIQFVGTFLRNYKEAGIEVYSEENKTDPIYSFKKDDDFGTKNYFVSGFGGPNLTTTKSHWKWDGRNATSEVMKDGKYTFVMNVKADGTDDTIPNQKMEFPVIIDTIHPRIVKSSYDQATGIYKLSEVEETGSGIRTKVITIGDKEYKADENGVFKLPENTDPKLATLKISDYAYNTVELRLDHSLRTGNEKTVIVSPVISTGSVPLNKFKWMVLDKDEKTVDAYNIKDGEYTLMIYNVEDPFELAEESNRIKFTVGKDDKDKVVTVRFNYKDRKQVTMQVTKPSNVKIKVVAVEVNTGVEYEATPKNTTQFIVNLPLGTYITKVRELDDNYYAKVENSAFMVTDKGLNGINPSINVLRKRMQEVPIKVDRGGYTGAFKLVFKGQDELKSTYEFDFASGESEKTVKLPLRLPFKVYVTDIEGYGIEDMSYDLKKSAEPINIKLIKGAKLIPVPVEKYDLSILVNKAKTLKEENYEPNSWSVFEKALDKAEKIYNNKEATQIQVNEVMKELKKAMDELLTKDRGDKKKLKAKVEEAEEIYNSLNDDYTEESKAYFQITIEAGRMVLNSDDPKYNTKKHIDDTIAMIDRGIKNLTRKDGKVNKVELGSLIKQAEDIVKNADKYTEESLRQLKVVLKDAKKVFEDEAATKDEVQNMVDALKTYIEEVESKADKSELKKEIDISSAINLALYNIEGKADFRIALENARNVYANKRALQNEIDDAKNELQQRREALVLKGEESKEVYKVPVKVKVSGSEEISPANDFINATMKAEKISGTENYRYTISTKAVGLELNNTNLSAEISRLAIVINGSETQVSRQNSDYVFIGGKLDNVEAIFNIDVLDELGDSGLRGTMVLDWANARK
ncbi:peptidase, S8/S53 family [Peptostreptococcaceae bacterium AS15]|nr:peptidase, S8/S53 family [Peptostreptococcaceae bacterium AS15]